MRNLAFWHLCYRMHNPAGVSYLYAYIFWCWGWNPGPCVHCRWAMLPAWLAAHDACPWREVWTAATLLALTMRLQGKTNRIQCDSPGWLLGRQFIIQMVDKSHHKQRMCLDIKIACFLIYVKSTVRHLSITVCMTAYTCIYRHELKSQTN